MSFSISFLTCSQFYWLTKNVFWKYSFFRPQTGKCGSWHWYVSSIYFITYFQWDDKKFYFKKLKIDWSCKQSQYKDSQHDLNSQLIMQKHWCWMIWMISEAGKLNDNVHDQFQMSIKFNLLHVLMTLRSWLRDYCRSVEDNCHIFIIQGPTLMCTKKTWKVENWNKCKHGFFSRFRQPFFCICATCCLRGYFRQMFQEAFIRYSTDPSFANRIMQLVKHTWSETIGSAFSIIQETRNIKTKFPLVKLCGPKLYTFLNKSRFK